MTDCADSQNEGAEPLSPDSVEYRIAELEARRQSIEQAGGGESLDMAVHLQEFAAFLKEKKLRALDARNMEARATVIFEKHGVPVLKSTSSKRKRGAKLFGKRIPMPALIITLIVLIVLPLPILLITTFAKRAQSISDPLLPGASTTMAGMNNITGRVLDANEGGEPVNLREALSDRKYTVLILTSGFCGPCQHIKPLLEQTAAVQTDVAYRWVHIDRPNAEHIDWDSPAAQQFHVHSVPSYAIYDTHRGLWKDGHAARDQVNQWINESGAGHYE